MSDDPNTPLTGRALSAHETARDTYVEAGTDLGSTPRGHEQLLAMAKTAAPAEAGLLLHLAEAGQRRRDANAAIAATVRARLGSSRAMGHGHTDDEAWERQRSNGTAAVTAADPADWSGPDGSRRLAEHLQAAHPGLTLIMSGVREADVVVLSKIVVPADQRGGGTGSTVMRQVLAAADRHGWTVALTPDSAFGTPKTTLTSWYKKLGFVPNKGRDKVFETTEAMVRPPRSGK